MAKLKIKTQQDRLREAWATLRAERDRRLAETDWVVVQAYERGERIPQAWAAYRQALRDLPERLTEKQVLSGDIPWPEPPKLRGGKVEDAQDSGSGSDVMPWRLGRR